MKREIYIMLTRGNDGKFAVSLYNTFSQAKEMLETYVSAQKEIEGVSGTVDIDYHNRESLSVPGFVFGYGMVMAHVTVRIVNDGKEIKTDRYIVKSTVA